MILKKKNIKIKTQISLGFCILLIFTILSNGVAIYHLSKISKKSNAIYNHPLRVGNAVRNINTYINAIHVNIDKLHNTDKLTEIYFAGENIRNYESLFIESFNTIESQYLGLKSSVQDVRTAFERCVAIADTIYSYKKLHPKISTYDLYDREFNSCKNNLIAKTKIISDFAENKADSLYFDIKDSLKKSIRNLTWIIINIVLIGIVIIIILSRNISDPIRAFVKQAEHIVDNKYENYFKYKTDSEEKLLSIVAKDLSDKYFEDQSIFSAIMDHSQAGIAVADADTLEVRYINKIGRKLLGNGFIGKEDAIKRYNDMLRCNIYHLDNSPYSKNDIPHIKAISDNKIISDEFIIKANPDSERYIWANAAPILNNAGKVIAGIVIFLDVTEQKMTIKELRVQNNKYAILNRMYKTQNKELIKAKKKAEEINRLKSSFMATMSHELRTPLNTVIGLSDLIDYEMSNSEIMEMISVINRNGNQLLDIVESILNLTQMQAGEYTVTKEKFSLIPFLNSLNEYAENELYARNKHHIRLTFSNKYEDNDIIIKTDKNKLRELLRHLMINAIKFTEEGVIEYGIKINNKDITFSIEDTGQGIDKKSQKIIFEKFTQTEDTYTRSVGGIGLGLATCKEISRLLKGKIGVKSEKGKGTVFSFRLYDVIQNGKT